MSADQVSSQTLSEPRHFEYIDGLRGVACIMVFFYHVTLSFVHANNGVMHHVPLAILEQGSRGVQLFYVLSAFTLFHSFAQRQGTDTNPLMCFFLRRFFRIAPLFYMMAVVYTAHSIATSGNLPTPWDAVLHATLLHGFSPFYINSLVPGGWSVGVEVAFYATVPLLFYWIKDLQKSIWCFMAAVILARLSHQIGIRVLSADSQQSLDSFLFFWLPNQLPVFILGIVLYYCIDLTRTDCISFCMNRTSGYLFISLAFLGMASFCFGPGYKILSTYIVFGIAFVLLCLGLAITPLFVFTNGTVRHIGKLSYSIYLVHPLWIHVTVHNILPTKVSLMTHFWGLLLIAGLLTAVFSHITYWYIEKPGIHIGKLLIKRLPN